ncbi:MAG: hypothetical protein LBU96_00650 [Yokenella regensburgei]|jgi:hypothetical protein|nr:hypothetical protein [Yokenella regensburgei]
MDIEFIDNGMNAELRLRYSILTARRTERELATAAAMTGVLIEYEDGILFTTATVKGDYIAMRQIHDTLTGELF